jgi:ATP synthase protein I
VNLVHKLTKQGQKLALKVLLFQSFIVIFVCAVILIFFQKFTAFSFFYGGLINVAANGVFAFFAFRYSGASQIKLMVRSFNNGAKLKLYITVLMAIVAFAGLNLEPLPLFIGFMVSNFCQWAAMIKTPK